MNAQLTALTIAESARLLQKKECSSEELTHAYLADIAAHDARLNCFITLCADEALAQARAADAARSAGTHVGPLCGIPLGLKDILLTVGQRTTCASKLLENYVAPYDGTVVSQLRKAGAVFLGKLNLDEFAMGSTNEHSAFGPVANPWNLDMIPGGSSGGSAAAVAASLCAGSLGTDTGGSIRQPASMCGVVGVKPTYGRVSRYGVIAFASSLDQVGPIGKSVEDCALLLEAIAGHDPHDATSLNAPVPPYAAQLSEDVRGLKVGVPREYFIEGIDTEVERSVRIAIEHYRALGADVRDISLPHTRYAVPAYYIIAPAEASSNLARYDGIRYGVRHGDSSDLAALYEATRSTGFGPEVTLRILLGTFVLSSGYYDAYYLKAQKVRTLIKQDFMNAFEHVDVIVAPTTPTPAFPRGHEDPDPVKMYLNDIFTIPVNLAGLPALSLPCGFTNTNLPIGMQLIGKPLDEAGILRAAYAYERSTEWHRRRPTLS